LNDKGVLGAYFTRLSHCEWIFGFYNRAKQSVTKAVELCEASGTAEEAAYAYVMLQWNHLTRNEYDQAISLKKKVLAYLAKSYNLRWHVWMCSTVSWAFTWLGHWKEAVEEGQEALKAAEKYSDDSLISFAAWIICIAYSEKRDISQALKYGEMAVTKAPTPADKALSQEMLARAWSLAGEPEKGIGALEEVLSIYRAGRFEVGIPNVLRYIALSYLLLSDYDGALKASQAYLEIAAPKNLPFHAGCAHRLLGETYLIKNSTLAEQQFEQSIPILQDLRAENELALAYAGLGRFHKQQGNNEQAREYLTNALEIFERLGTLLEPDKVRKELGKLSEK
jgi:tetratricopeptide (TPR) repeat protein